MSEKAGIQIDLLIAALAPKLRPALHIHRLVHLWHHDTTTRWLFY